jgi:uncharacterized membrane protein
MDADTPRWRRIAAHLWQDERDVHRVLDTAARQRLHDRVAAAEQGHSGEIRVCVEGGLPGSYLWRRASARERAVTMFGKLRVWDTEHNNGVLIYLLLAEHRIEVVADRGFNHRVTAAQWDGLAGGMAAAFKSGQVEQGLSAAIDAVGTWMRQHFPLAEGDNRRNELPDTVFIQ